MIVKTIKEFIVIQLFIMSLKWFQIFCLFIVCLGLAMTSNRYKDFFYKESYVGKVGYSVFENVRYNMRVLWGSVLPIDPAMYHDISEIDKKTLPDPKKALFKLNKSQQSGLYLIKEDARGIEDATVRLYVAIRNYAKQHKFKDISKIEELESDKKEKKDNNLM